MLQKPHAKEFYFTVKFESISRNTRFKCEDLLLNNSNSQIKISTADYLRGNFKFCLCEIMSFAIQLKQTKKKGSNKHSIGVPLFLQNDHAPSKLDVNIYTVSFDLHLQAGHSDLLTVALRNSPKTFLSVFHQTLRS